MKLSLKYLLALLIILSADLVYGQSQPREIRLKYADSLVGSDTPGSAYRDFFGNVQLEHGDVNVRSDFAKQYLESNKADLIGNVIITQRTLTLRSPKIFYDGNTSISRAVNGVTIRDMETFLKADGGTYNTITRVAVMNDNVYIEDDSATIVADNIIHYRNDKKSYAYGNVWIVGKYTNALLYSDTLINIPAENYSLAYGKPVLFQIDSIYVPSDTIYWAFDSITVNKSYFEYDTLSVTSDTMHAYREIFNEKYIFSGNVEIVKGEVRAKCGEAIFFKDDGYIQLIGKPVVWYDSTQLYGDSIIIRMPDKELKSIESYNNSIAVSRNDTLSLKRLDQIMGERIYIEIDSSKVVGITSIGDAKSLYYFRDEEGESGADRRSTDTIKVQFIDGEVENIFWLGMTFAEFFPETFVYGKEESYYLPLFNWIDNKPSKRQVVLPLEKFIIKP
jgi:lipopolysaccharide export system protein LptA